MRLNSDPRLPQVDGVPPLKTRLVDLFRDIAKSINQLAFSSAHDGQEPLRMGDYYLWIDSSGRLRVKSGRPTSDTDGTIVGTQT